MITTKKEFQGLLPGLFNLHHGDEKQHKYVFIGRMCG